ncbi:VapC toxin family PIN domain ribonuclease [Erwinia sp. INIA-01]|uniref:VapC toxin family PIN domain ribonuclease n=1 Tax=Erwiniaceae TaxID=1903409 RepID=UPI001EF8FD65|nr:MULTISPECIES: VapC toxin family PIN domain ribonuclease [Erwiniaceae]MBM7342721.1 putative nucleic acid-binding protein [Pantoea coffeiphila]MCW1875989.1 VapC toxin family PIN domain ribonuclease [Erwinia sp. INIA01]
MTGMKEGCKLSDPENGLEIPDPGRRIQALLDMIESSGGSIIIPTPVLAEYLVGIDKSEHQNYIRLIQRKSCFEIASFDEIAAIECAQMPSIKELKAMMKSDTANKVKFDRQIISIAKSLNVDEIWTHDIGVFKRCKEMGMIVKSLADIEPTPIQVLIDMDHDHQTELH